MSTFWISILVVIVILLLVQIRILKSKIERKDRHLQRMGDVLTRNRHDTYADVIMRESLKPIGKRSLCKDCKLHKWFIINPIDSIVSDNEVLIRKNNG